MQKPSVAEATSAGISASKGRGERRREGLAAAVSPAPSAVGTELSVLHCFSLTVLIKACNYWHIATGEIAGLFLSHCLLSQTRKLWPARGSGLRGPPVQAAERPLAVAPLRWLVATARLGLASPGLLLTHSLGSYTHVTRALLT